MENHFDYLVRGDLSGSQYVSVGSGCFLSFPSPAFHGNDAEYALREWRFYPALAMFLCIFPLLAFSLLPHLKRAIESHKYENIK